MNQNFKLLWVWLALLWSGHAYALTFSQVPPSMKEAFENFLSPQFDESKALDEWAHVKMGHKIYHLKYPSDMDSLEKIGYSHKKNIKVFHAARTKEQLLFRTQYEFDEFGRRKIGLEKRQEQDQHIILAGCSFAMGTSLLDHDTLGFHLGRLAKSHFPVNIGVAGSGTNTMLAMTRHNLAPENVFADDGVFIYVYLDFHIARANGFAMEREWLWDTPHYSEDEDGHLIYRGNFKKSEPSWTAFFHSSQSILKKLKLAFNYPKLSQKHIDYTCKLIKETKRSYLEKFPKGSFFVYAHPYSKVKPEIEQCLKSSEVTLIKSSLPWSSEDVIPFDDHPNGSANRKIAAELVESLEL